MQMMSRLRNKQKGRKGLGIEVENTGGTKEAEEAALLYVMEEGAWVWFALPANGGVKFVRFNSPSKTGGREKRDEAMRENGWVREFWVRDRGKRGEKISNNEIKIWIREIIIFENKNQKIVYLKNFKEGNILVYI